MVDWDLDKNEIGQLFLKMDYKNEMWTNGYWMKFRKWINLDMVGFWIIGFMDLC